MQWLTPWTVAGAVLCVLALVVLFFPFIFRIDFEACLSGAWARLYFFKKLVYKVSKKFENEKGVGNEADEGLENEDAVVPEYVPPKKKVERNVEKFEARASAAVERQTMSSEILPEERQAASDETSPPTASNTVAVNADIELPAVSQTVSRENSPTESSGRNQSALAQDCPADIEPPAASPTASGAPHPAGNKPPAASPPASNEPRQTNSSEHSQTASNAVPPAKKRSLTDTEFWTILLTPEFDETAFWAIKKWSLCTLHLFKVQFRDCFVEGIRGDVLSMGYGAALNGILRAYPYVGAWDLRMDWTHDHELRAAGQIHASVNVCRILGLVIATVFYGGIIAYKFWRRRARVLKTNELPELGWIRTKIVKMMAEE